MSGAGKTTVAHALEDEGFFVIDNLPIAMICRLTELVLESRGEVTKVALVVDVRESGYLQGLKPVVEILRGQGLRVEVLFLDCADEVIMRRFTETRRRHPVLKSETVEEGIRMERELLKDVKVIADRTVDTTYMNVHQLKKMVEDFAGEPLSSDKLKVSVMSFGFKYGIPQQADVVFDARFLPNPFFIPKLKGLTGMDQAVAEFVLSHVEAREYIDLVMKLLEFQLPFFSAEGKVYLNVAIGCTGGQHRSVAIAENISSRLREKGVPVKCWHRDIDKK